MPISVNAELVKLSQREFGNVAYDVVRHAFDVQRELGRLFDEKVYQNAIAARLGNAMTEVRIDVSFGGFCKPYFIDLLVCCGAPFELKATSGITVHHRNQLLHYLLLTELHHGKVLNFRPERVEHEFVNTHLTHSKRKVFTVETRAWHATKGFGVAERQLCTDIVEDWGTGLKRELYERALIHMLGGADQICRTVNVRLGRGVIAQQPVLQCAPQVAFRITTFENGLATYRQNLHCFLHRTDLEAIQWINISLKQLTIETIAAKGHANGALMV